MVSQNIRRIFWMIFSTIPLRRLRGWTYGLYYGGVWKHVEANPGYGGNWKEH